MRFNVRKRSHGARVSARPPQSGRRLAAPVHQQRAAAQFWVSGVVRRSSFPPSAQVHRVPDDRLAAQRRDELGLLRRRRRRRRRAHPRRRPRHGAVGRALRLGTLFAARRRAPEPRPHRPQGNQTASRWPRRRSARRPQNPPLRQQLPQIAGPPRQPQLPLTVRPRRRLLRHDLLRRLHPHLPRPLQHSPHLRALRHRHPPPHRPERLLVGLVSIHAALRR
mmetsp:Transcript_27872/g.85522  ORF Transcript_27872/g.85522 Transcript_27872/m.85522 type:complete len:221 (-) Transcript_27872:1541-2203(-)